MTDRPVGPSGWPEETREDRVRALKFLRESLMANKRALVSRKRIDIEAPAGAPRDDRGDRRAHRPPPGDGLMKRWEVHVIPKRPACNDRGSTVDVVAATKREALKKGRHEVVHVRGDYDRLDGALVVTATESED